MNAAGNKLNYSAGGNLEINVLYNGDWMIEGDLDYQAGPESYNMFFL